MRPIANAIVRTGIVSKEVLAEMKRWGLPVDMISEEKVADIHEAQQVVNIIRDALESSDQVMVKGTDLDLLKSWLIPDNQREGRIFIKDEDNKTSFKIIFIRTPLKEFVIPFRSDSIIDLLTNGESHLKFTDDDGNKQTVFFHSVREFYIGEKKAFMICEAA
jgi:hypothetical protein